jgi:hypothetical protein
MIDPILKERATEYARLSQININLERRLGFGQDGAVWKSDRNTAVKSLLRLDNYRNELRCYQRFLQKNVTRIFRFSVPQLVKWNDSLQIIEMKIVTPPYILDFGKVWIDKRPDYSPETWQDYYAALEERFGDDTREVRKLVSALQVEYGIWYMDAKPGNIRLRPD